MKGYTALNYPFIMQSLKDPHNVETIVMLKGPLILHKNNKIVNLKKNWKKINIK